MYLIKDNKIISVAIINDKVVTTIQIDGKWISLTKEQYEARKQKKI